MTYGENSREMRESMAVLLGWRRIQQRLGGGGSHTVPVTTTAAERERMGQIIQRYRLSALTWCLQAVTATTPKIDRPHGPRGPAMELRYGLAAAVTAAGPSERLSDLLAVRHGSQLLDGWQRLARAAVVGEPDFGAAVTYVSLTAEQTNTVLTDVADLTRGLVLLDRRYTNVPGWAHLEQPTSLDRAAEATAILAREFGTDDTVDARGWRTPAGRIEGPALPGVAGAVQAQHNLLVELGRFPDGLRLRRVLHSQAQVSHEAAKHAATAAPDLAERFSARALLYRDLVRASRDVGGLAGGGGQAAVESQNAASRLQQSHARLPESPEQLHHLARLMARTDARIATTVEHGFNERLYFVSVNYPRLTDESVRGVHPARQRWIPVTWPIQTDLIPLVREPLRPHPPTPAAEPESIESRRAYQTVLMRPPGMPPRSGPTR